MSPRSRSIRLIYGGAKQTVQFLRLATSVVVVVPTWEVSHYVGPLAPFSLVIMVWTGDHRGFAVRSFFENGRSFVAAQRAFRLHFNVPRRDPVPHRNVIAGWIRALEETGSTTRSRGMGRPKSVKTPENMGAVRAAFEQSPRHSARKHVTALSMSNRFLRRILHEDIKFHPYKMMIVQELMPPDFQNRVNRAQEMKNRILLRSTFFSSDEAHFHLSGAVNKQNFRYWVENNPRKVYKNSTPRKLLCGVPFRNSG